MQRILVVPASQTEAAILQLEHRPNVGVIEVELYYVADFMGIWLKITQDPKGNSPYNEMASPALTQQLKAEGLGIGDHVIVVREACATSLKVRIVSPISLRNWYLVGKRFGEQSPSQQSLLSG